MIRHFVDSLSWQECGIIVFGCLALVGLIAALAGAKRNAGRPYRDAPIFRQPGRWDQDLK